MTNNILDKSKNGWLFLSNNDLFLSEILFNSLFSINHKIVDEGGNFVN